MGLAVKNNVDKLLALKKWSLYRLSKESGVSQTVLYSLEQKEKGPTADTLIKIAGALNCSVDDLLKNT
ncbi:helix-turn-helix transcriptional regulator [Paenibacillus sp. 11B]|uniref:helix-turn-helix domain-containing protein n=1 Tax=Paenibacillus sp. 11B TaxID=3060965 RepID=UPI00264C9E33|nr:helix-turn-helix transcriptional regulator [Paenibacillus sp. 11B]MDN8588774.1 helix-turn-helix transcriptional regulator [Paenibacillus sp. 11B]